ncbi:GAF domain-containing protein [Flammeovirga kamogawensis]|nr:GAF domain-containing protein [Flammeovirga kamogawensis]
MIFRKTFRFRLIVLFVINTTLLLMTLGTVYLTAKSLTETSELTEKFKQCSSLYTESEIYYKNFLLEDLITSEFYKNRKSTNTVRSINLLDSSLIAVEEVRKQMDELDDPRAKEMEFLRADLEQLKAQQDFLMRKYLDLGFKDWGMIGNMRSKIHKIEATEFDYNLGLLLTMRRNEKDFLLRGESKYIRSFDESVENFEKHIVKIYQLQRNSSFSEQDVRKLRASLAAYQFGMHKVVDLMKSIGRGQNSGLMKQVSDLQGQINLRLLSLSENVLSNNATYVKWMVATFLFIFFLQSVILGWFIFRFTRMLNKRFNFLFKISSALSSGQKLDKLKEESDGVFDEVKEISSKIFEVDEQFSAANDFSKKVTDGNVDVNYQKQFENTPLANDLLQMRNKFRDVQEEEYRRNWATQGMADFNQLLRVKMEDEEEWFDNLLRKIIEYIGASQGTFILVQENKKQQQVLQVMAMYAYDKKRYESKHYDIESGLLGQVYKEQQMVYIEDVPNDYINITSGMGGAKPKSLVILPLMYSDKMYGILEISSFNKFDEYKIDFLLKLSEVIASSISDMDTSRVVIQMKNQLDAQKQRISELEKEIYEIEKN